MSDLTKAERKALKFVGLSEPPERYKPVEDWTVEEHVQVRRLDGPGGIESEEYRRYRAAIDAAGGDTKSDLDAMSVEDHIERKRHR